MVNTHGLNNHNTILYRYPGMFTQCRVVLYTSALYTFIHTVSRPIRPALFAFISYSVSTNHKTPPVAGRSPTIRGERKLQTRGVRREGEASSGITYR